jgi:hypothetical protein
VTTAARSPPRRARYAASTARGRGAPAARAARTAQRRCRRGREAGWSPREAQHARRSARSATGRPAREGWRWSRSPVTAAPRGARPPRSRWRRVGYHRGCAPPGRIGPPAASSRLPAVASRRCRARSRTTITTSHTGSARPARSRGSRSADGHQLRSLRRGREGVGRLRCASDLHQRPHLQLAGQVLGGRLASIEMPNRLGASSTRCRRRPGGAEEARQVVPRPP